jgi:long-chain fatty acid transport protein
VPDANRWTYAAGGSYQLTPHIALDAAASYVDFSDTTIDRNTAAYAGTAAQMPIITNGLLKNAHAVVLSMGGRITF